MRASKNKQPDNLQPATCNLTLGLLGSGQLGQMMAMAAKKWGIACWCTMFFQEVQLLRWLMR